MIITSREVFTEGALNFKMAASCFVNVTEEVVNAIEENSVLVNTNDATNLGVTPVKRQI